jgi:hypothetical protein
MLKIGGLKFQPVSINYNLVVEKNLFSKRQGSIFNVLNKNLGLPQDKNKKARQIFAKELKEEPNSPIGALLLRLKLAGDMRYLSLLNKYGDLEYSKFYIENETDKFSKGIYAFVFNKTVKYVGRCRDNFGTRIDRGYGNIDPYNCYKGGQSTNCHINNLVTTSIQRGNIELFVHISDDDEFITKEEKRLIEVIGSDSWNILR